jgi:quercetin dioxygenase-like cupin family protein
MKRTTLWLVLLGAGCTPSAADSPDPPPSNPEVTTETPAEPTTQATGSVVTLDTAPRSVAGSGKAWITRLAQGENAFVGMLEMAPGAAVPEHQDATEEYIYFLSGSGTLTMAGTSYEVSTGSFIYMPAGITVSFQNGDAPAVAMQVFAGPAPAKKYDGWQPAARTATP